MIFIIQSFQTIVFIFIVLFTTFWLLCPLFFFRYFLLNSGANTELEVLCNSLEKEQDNELLFLNELVTCTEPGFRLSMYHKPTFTGQYPNFNSHRPYNVKKEIICCLQHHAKAISSNTDAYQEEMISLRHNLHCNNYPESITSAPRNLDSTIKNDTWKLSTVCLPYIEG